MPHPKLAEAQGGPAGEARRDFLYIVTGAMTAVGVGAAMWPFIDSMNPSADIRELSTIGIDPAPIEVGQRITTA